MPAAITAIDADRVPRFRIAGMEAALGFVTEAMVEVSSCIAWISCTAWEEVYRGCKAISLQLALSDLPMTNK